MRVHFIVNPVAGRRTSVPYVQEVMARVETQGIACSMAVTRFAGDGEDHARSLDGDVDRVVVAGGDGTLAEVVNGLGPERCPVGVIPMGTANLVARETRMPAARDVDATARALLASRPWTVDLMQTTSARGTRYSLATVGAGLDGTVVHALEDVRNAPGMGGYARWLAPITDTLRRFPRPTLTIHVDERRTFAAMGCIVQNTRNYGGLFELSPTAAMDSGVLDVMLLRIRARRDLLRLLVGGATRRLTRYHDLRFARGDKIRIECPDRAPVQADGDSAGHTDVTIKRRARALELLRAPPTT